MIGSPAVPVARREEAEESLERRRSQHVQGTEQKGMKEEEEEVWEERKYK